MHLCEKCEKGDVCGYKEKFEGFMDCNEMEGVNYIEDDVFEIRAGIYECAYFKEATDADTT